MSRMKRLVLSIVIPLVLLLSAAASAQSKEELKFRKTQADKIHSYAKSAFKKGFPLKAKRVWLMLLSEYDPNHEKARTAIGYQRAGRSWVLRKDFVYPTYDKPDPKAASSLRIKW